MKKSLFLFLLLNTTSVFSQKNTLNNTNIVFYETNNPNVSVDKLSFKGYTYKVGGPIFIVINIEGFTPNEDFLAKREQQELIKNFGGKVDFINHTTVIKFLNRFNTSMKFTYEQSPKKVIYWSGKFDEKPIIYDGLIKSSEYFGERLNLNKNSSYIDEFNKKLADFTTDFIDNPTENSILISTKFMKEIVSRILFNFDNESIFFNMNFKNVKHITYKTNLDKDVNQLKEIFFDKNGYPTRIIFDDIKDKKYKYETIFEYDKDILKKSIRKYNGEIDNESSFFYKNNEMYIYGDYSITKYLLSNNQFLNNEYYFYDTEKFYFTVNQTIHDNNSYRYIEYDHMNDRIYKFNSNTIFFPIEVKIRDNRPYKIEKINQYLYKENAIEKDIYFHFNEKNLISKIIYQSKDKTEKELIIEYLYEYYE